jgi:hypothetical protein
VKPSGSLAGAIGSAQLKKTDGPHQKAASDPRQDLLAEIKNKKPSDLRRVEVNTARPVASSSQDQLRMELAEAFDRRRQAIEGSDKSQKNGEGNSDGDSDSDDGEWTDDD